MRRNERNYGWSTPREWPNCNTNTVPLYLQDRQQKLQNGDDDAEPNFLLVIFHYLWGAEDRDDSAQKSDRHGRHEEQPGVDGIVMERSEFLLQHFPYDIGQNLVDVRIAPSEKGFLLFVPSGNESFEGRQSVNLKSRFGLRETNYSSASHIEIVG